METWPGLVPALPRVPPRELELPVVLRRPEVEDRGCAELVDSPCMGTCKPQQVLCTTLGCADAADSYTPHMCGGASRLQTVFVSNQAPHRSTRPVVRHPEHGQQGYRRGAHAASV